MATINPINFKDRSEKNILIRTLRGEDSQGAREFFEKISVESTGTNHFPENPNLPSEIQFKTKWQSTLDDPLDIYIGAFFEGKLIGQISVKALSPGHPWLGHLAMFGMMILKDHWNSGIGAKLINAMDSHIMETPLKRVEATVRTDNPGAIHLYKKMGFKIEGTREKAAYIENIFQDEYFIAKIY